MPLVSDLRSQAAEVSVETLIPPPLMMSPPEKVEVAEEPVRLR